MLFADRRAAAMLLACLFLSACVGGAKKPARDAGAEPVRATAKAPRAEKKAGNKDKKPAASSASEQDQGEQLPQLVRQDYQLALGALKNGKYEVAETLLKPLVERYPEFSGPLANMAIVYFNTGREDQALEAFEKVTEQSPNAIARNYMGIIYRRRGEFDKALRQYQEAIMADSTYANAYLNMGILHDLYLGNLQAALVSYRHYQQLTGGADKQVSKWIIDIERRL